MEWNMEIWNVDVNSTYLKCKEHTQHWIFNSKLFRLHPSSGLFFRCCCSRIDKRRKRWKKTLLVKTGLPKSISIFYFSHLTGVTRYWIWPGSIQNHFHYTWILTILIDWFGRCETSLICFFSLSLARTYNKTRKRDQCTAVNITRF